jgi:AraC-like DNA-binding protein
MPDRPQTRTAINLEDPWPSDDALSDALRFVRVVGAFYGHSELTEPWGLTLPALPEHVWFHAPIRGSCRLESEGVATYTLQPGDFALVPHGHGHRLRSAEGAPAPSILELERDVVSGRYEVLRHGGGGAAAVLICGAVRLDDAAAADLRRMLPHTLLIGRTESRHAQRLHHLLAVMAAEVGDRRPGGEAVVTRLADALVLLAIRAWIEHDPAAHDGWLAALRDRHIGLALQLIHRNPEQRWTLDSLARRVAMSRSAFAERFTGLVGEPAMQYALRWRMQRAVVALRDEGLSVAQVAHQLGYTSDAAFSRAFKRVIGVSPGAVRRGGIPT